MKSYNLPLQYYNESTLVRLGSSIGNVLGVHKDTLNLTQQAYAKVCIKMDVCNQAFHGLYLDWHIKITRLENRP